MGNQPSKESNALTHHEKAVLDRVKDLKIEEDYVEISDEKQHHKTIALSHRTPESLNPIFVNGFIRQVLDDPKNRYSSISRAFSALRATI